MLRLYDTRRRTIVPLRPLRDELTLYVCGVTPYDTTHLGHARTFLAFDVLVRLLELQGRAVRYAQNVTDIDESILQRASRDGVGWRELGGSEVRAFTKDMRALGWRRPDVMPHATREIAQIHDLIRRLESRGAAYRLPRGMYFSVAKARAYGDLSRLPAAKMVRILAGQDDAAMEDPGRRDPRDFALWRFVDSGPTWPSPWGRGRPGWHIECSAMSLHHLGERIDVHGGGADLIYPHHENEIAQTETATGKRPFVGIWMHAGMMKLGGKKMSKSDGNMVFVRDALQRVSPAALRLYLLDVHYRRAHDHDEARLARSVQRSERLAAALGRGRGALGSDRASRAVLAHLETDLDTPRAIRALESAVRADPDAKTRASLRAIARALGIVPG
ncbi:MAG TPA: cysteine--tRNA ligase [Candidatus Limnocylindria bacterium]|nr:cysteine--tRNA ligase [Candidatus Limnocylindria bacterium]